MKQHKRSKPSPVSIPRSDSLLYRLQQAPEPEGDGLPYLDQLMIFLEDPPPRLRDRWKKGAEMCAAWGFPCSAPAVWRLYRSYAIEWRLLFADEVDAAAKPDEQLDEKVAQLAERRIFAALSDPQLSADSLAHFVRLELRRQALAFARDRYEEKTSREIHAERMRQIEKEGQKRLAEIRFEGLQKAFGLPRVAPPHSET